MKNNNTKKIISLALVFVFLFAGKVEAKGLNFRKGVLDRQKANVSSFLEKGGCERIEKIENKLSEKISSVADSSNKSLTEKTIYLQESWAKEDSLVYEKRTETMASLNKKFDKLESKIAEENKSDFLLFKNKVFSSVEKRNREIDEANEEYRTAIFSFLYEYSQKKNTYFEDFEKRVGEKISEKKNLCLSSGNEEIKELENFMKEENNNLTEGLGGAHFRDFVEQKREEKNDKINKTKAVFEKEISDARKDFTDF